MSSKEVKEVKTMMEMEIPPLKKWKRGLRIIVGEVLEGFLDLYVEASQPNFGFRYL